MAVLTGAVASLATAGVSPSGVSYRLLVRDFRFREDNGDEVSASWAAPLNTDLPDIDSSINYRVRFSIENVGQSADSVLNQGHLEVSEDGGAYKTMGMDAFTSPVVIPPHSLELVSTVTPVYTDESVDGDGRLFVDSNGIWHLAYYGYEAAAPTVRVIIIRTSITQGQTWRKHKFDIDNEEVMQIVEDTAGAILVITKSYIIRSTTSGLTWADPLARPVISGTNYFNFFVTTNNDYILAELYDTKYYISDDLGVTWDTYQNNDFPAALGLAAVYYELDDSTADLTVWYAGTTSNDDPVKIYRWIDTYPYSGFPNASEDDVSQLLFTGDSGLANTFETSVFVRSVLGMNLILYSSGWGVEPPAAIVETATDIFEVKALDYISQTWDDTGTFDTSPRIIKAIRQGRDGSVLYTDRDAFGFSGGNSDDTPGFMGWFLYGNTNVDSVQYSPSVNKWYAVETLTSGDINCYEFVWSQEGDGARTTQQISSGSYAASNYGYTDINTIHGADRVAVPAGEVGEYEYAFRLRPSEDIAGKVVCLRPSGFSSYDNIACFTIPVGHAALSGTATATINGDTDGPHCDMEAGSPLGELETFWDLGTTTWDLGTTTWDEVVGTLYVGHVLRNAAVSMNCQASVIADLKGDKLAVTNLLSEATATGTVYLTKPCAVNMLVDANLTLASTNTKPFACTISSAAAFTGGSPGNEIHVKSTLSTSCVLSPTAQKEVVATAWLHSYARAAVAASPEKICISLTIYQEALERDFYTEWDEGGTVWDAGETVWDGKDYVVSLSITQPAPLTIVINPARLTITKPPALDLTIKQQLPLTVYI